VNEIRLDRVKSLGGNEAEERHETRGGCGEPAAAPHGSRSAPWATPAIALALFTLCLAAWFWTTGSYRRLASQILNDPITHVEYQASSGGPFIQLADQSSIADVRRFLIEAGERPDLGEPGREVPVFEPYCVLRIRFANGHVETLRIGDTLPLEGAGGRALVVATNSVIAWKGYRRYGDGKTLGELYGRLLDSRQLFVREQDGTVGPALSVASGRSAGPFAPRTQISGHGLAARASRNPRDR
jgi:hypothetical protein